MNNDALHKEVKTICDNFRQFPEMLGQAFHLFVMDYYKSEDSVIELLRDGRKSEVTYVPWIVEQVPGQVRYRTVTVQEFFSEYLRNFLRYPPVQTREVLASWMVMVDAVHMNLIETFSKLLERMIVTIQRE